jgi:hypothetical protein
VFLGDLWEGFPEVGCFWGTSGRARLVSSSQGVVKGVFLCYSIVKQK